MTQLSPERHRPEPLAGPLEHNDVMRELQLRSRLDRSAARGPRTPSGAPLGPLTIAAAEPHAPVAPAVPVAPAPPGTQPLDDLLRRRLAVRAYAPEPVAAEELAAVLEQARDFDRQSWPDAETGQELQFLVAARNVAGLPAGLYGYTADQGGFRRLADLPEGAAAEDMVLQREFALSPAIVLVCGSLAGSLDRHGDHGHRLLMARAGAAAHTAWLAALDQGLDGSIFAGFLASALKPLLGLDGYRTAQLLAFAVGRPAAGDPSAVPAP